MAGNLKPARDPGREPEDSLQGRVFSRFHQAVVHDNRTSAAVRVVVAWLCVTVVSVTAGLLVPMRHRAAVPPQDSEFRSLVRMHDMRVRAFAGWMSASHRTVRQQAP